MLGIELSDDKYVLTSVIKIPLGLENLLLIFIVQNNL